MIFGEKKVFAIELEPTDKHNFFYLCFWVRNIKIGRFTKSGELNDSIHAYEKFSLTKSDLYIAKFDSFKPEEILLYLWGRDSTTLEQNISDEEARNRFKIYISLLYFGDQFINSNLGVLFLYKHPNVIFLIEKGVQNVKRFEIKIDEFNKAFDEYIAYSIKRGFIDKVVK